MTATVVVCAYTEDRWERLTQAIRSIVAQQPVPAQVVVVIDHNESLLHRVRGHVEEAGLSGVEVVSNRFTQGLSGARNTGLEHARSEIVAFIDDDAEATPGWLAQLVAAFGDPWVVGVGGAIEPVWPSQRPGWFPREFDWVVGCTYQGMPTVRSEVRNPIGANMAFRREPLRLIGGFDPSVGRVGTRPEGCEETAAAIRMRALDARNRVLFEPRALVLHHVELGRTSWRYFRRRCYAEGVSKAQVARLTSADKALATERTYVRTVLPRAVGTSLRSAVRRRSPVAAGTAGAVIAGLTFTGVGYLAGASRPVQEHQ